MPDYGKSARILWANRFFCSRECAEAYIAGGEEHRKSIRDVLTN